MNGIQTTTSVRDPAETYDELFVPALFAQWGPRVTEAAAVGLGQRALDVGCGTGVLACAVAERVGPTGHVVGLDPNSQMLSVAKRKSRSIAWQLGRAEALPFDDLSFDVVVSQFALMFVDSQSAAIAEMLRVLRPGGRLAVAVWDSLNQVPGYLMLAELLRDLFGNDVAGTMYAPFTLGNRCKLLRSFADAGARGAELQTYHGSAFFASIDAMISTERACVWTLGGILNEQQFACLRANAPSALQRFVRSDGRVQFDCPAHIVTWAKV